MSERKEGQSGVPTLPHERNTATALQRYYNFAILQHLWHIIDTMRPTLCSVTLGTMRVCVYACVSSAERSPFSVHFLVFTLLLEYIHQYLRVLLAFLALERCKVCLCDL